MRTAEVTTLREYFAAFFGRTSPERFERLCAIRVDGKELGAYPTGIKRSREEQKRFEEIQWAGIALVGCDADLEVVEIRSLAPRRGQSTADFEAVTKTGERPLLELARIIDAKQIEQDNYFALIAGRAQSILEQTSGFADAGRFLYELRYGPRSSISRKDAERAAAELAALIISDERLHHASVYKYEVQDANAYPVLTKLGVFVNHDEDDAEPTRVLWHVGIEPADSKRSVAIFEDIRRKKGAKVAAYSNAGSVPVWLALAAFSNRQRFVAIATVNALKETTLDPAPFSQILIGCFTAGVKFTEPDKPPDYTSLSTTG